MRTLPGPHEEVGSLKRSSLPSRAEKPTEDPLRNMVPFKGYNAKRVKPKIV